MKLSASSWEATAANRAGAGLHPGVHQGDFPVVQRRLLQVFRIGVGPRMHPEIGRHLLVAEEVLLDVPCVVAEAEDEASVSEVSIQLHDVSQDRLAADIDQRLRQLFRCLAGAGTLAPAEDDHGHIGWVRTCHTLPSGVRLSGVGLTELREDGGC